MTIRLVAIKPRGAIIPVQGLQLSVDRELRDFAVDFQREMATYPPARPWKRPPKSGPRRGGRRTGGYGKGWGYGRIAPGLIEVVNEVEYAVHVGGPKSGAKGKRQALSMALRGWPNVTEVSQRVWERHRGAVVRSLTAGRR